MNTIDIAEQKRIESKKRIYIKYYYSDKHHERIKTESREKYHKNQKYKKATLERARNRYHEDEEYKKATIRRAIERHRKLRLKKIFEKQLSNSIFQNGIIHLPKEEEIILVTKSKIKSVQLIILLKNYGFKVRRPYQKENKFIHSIYGKDLEEKLQKIFSAWKENNLQKRA